MGDRVRYEDGVNVCRVVLAGLYNSPEVPALENELKNSAFLIRSTSVHFNSFTMATVDLNQVQFWPPPFFRAISAPEAQCVNNILQYNQADQILEHCNQLESVVTASGGPIGRTQIRSSNPHDHLHSLLRSLGSSQARSANMVMRELRKAHHRC
jgi:hypothetical protein